MRISSQRTPRPGDDAPTADVGERPHAGKPTAELIAIGRWLDQHVRELCIERAMIRTELTRRGIVEPPAAPLPVNEAEETDPYVVAYRTAPSPLPGDIGDLYADEARRYSLRITLAAGAIIVGACAGLVVLALM